MNAFERSLAKSLGRDNLARIQRVKVGIAGAGGLGSNCALFLVRSGFKRLRLVDFDLVEYSNLNRQFFFAAQVGRQKVDALKENLLLINPKLEIEIMPERIEQENAGEIFADCDAVVEALDLAGSKKMLVEAILNTGKLLVAASGVAGWGRIDDIKICRVKNNFYLVGDLVSEAAPGCPVLAPGVNVAAAKQADIVLSYFLRSDKLCL
ncbi:thiamine biosynthesis protein ThiF [Desulfofarcimen acetoxidans DSM 771]|jgi:sulfur carrier protein ThiS adenylyltransferase|uniref:Thiamine biosynthesis protein ThiF n=1 Tax=Desulfofarcimen acetoxidans (strain ATCC 49208 / DSM 771 / KCTC 5769 / VKM B-1644 / 5575) TaxID=485916 RepID=C8VWW3_DESAS|nr:sulfur carrier protein ThiS adenylyltransferase ThiF [Desulfofarcimen acetoxidans]ACV62539.1 thiamine biosynthesis protein ThiF [Desulfofarcimen acetoxidans DSM 771]